ncbi:MAG: 2-succinyl-5-enolpyruvyl-6-hydroxy-3-cyclohexene-1-carboxylic-acid synthase [Gemmatimonadota bacterium]|nr:2-succinyl-5-enolpyruvyl-6-hydroxy-3-cyclohexene-1-carboxylic-acid synthase [Gemmatimonadota bacterium]
MSAPNRNTLWARTLADELARHGLRHVCVGSGSRSAPLVEAFAADDRFMVHPHVDERSAGFFALGVAAATSAPAAVVTTSGTATANVFPAVIEAAQSDIPLLVLTADRPAALRGLDANQTIDQVRLYGAYPRATLDLPLPRPREGDLRRLRVAAARAWAAAVGAAGAARGPVHVNVQFEKPLEPVQVDGDVPDELEVAAGRPNAAPHTVIGAGPAYSAADAEVLADRLAGARRPVIVCGPGVDPASGPAAIELAAKSGACLIADPLSGARFGPGADTVSVACPEAVIADHPDALVPDLVVRVGAAPTSAAVNRWLETLAGVAHIVVDSGSRWKDHSGVASLYVHGAPGPTLEAAAARVDAEAGDAAWLVAWGAASRAAMRVLAEAIDPESPVFEGGVAAAVTGAVPEGGQLFVGNSMPIRDVDAFAAPSARAIRALGFRGASGIDGNVSGALGACAGASRPTAALIGDLTLLHDVGALLTADRPPAAVQIVVVQNRGGGIFHMLPIRDFDPPFTRHVVMPQNVEISAVAEAAGIPHRLTATVGDLAAELETGWSEPGIRVLEVPIDREDNWTRRRSALESARQAVARALAAL